MTQQLPSSNWVKWQEGESIDLTIITPQATGFAIHWANNQSQRCTGPNCPFCAAGGQAKQRWSAKVKIGEATKTWEMANLTYQSLYAIADAYGGMMGLNVRVKRTGLGRATRYTIVPLTPMPENPAKRESQAMIGYARELCEAHAIQPKDEFKRFLTDEHPEVRSQPQRRQLQLFIEWLETEYPDVALGEEPLEGTPEDEIVDIDGMFDNF